MLVQVKKMRKTLSIILAMGACLALPSYANSDVSLLSMWRTPGERAALYEIIDQAVESDLSWSNFFASHHFNGTRAEFVRLTIADKSPQMVQWVIGPELHKLISQDILQPIPFDASKSAVKFRPEISRIATYEKGKLNSFPIGINTKNHLVLNRKVWENAGLNLPRSARELFDALSVFEEKGVVPIAVSGEKWQVRNLMLGLLSVYMPESQFRQLIKTPERLTRGHAKSFAKAFEKLRQISKVANKDFRHLNWNDVTYKVARGEAASQINSDMVGAELYNDENMVCMIMPGANYLLWDAESLVLANHPESTKELKDRIFGVLLSEKTHQRYVLKRGGIPAIVGIDPKELSPCSRNNLATWDEYEKHRIWLDGDTIRTTLERVGAVSADFLNDQGMSVDDAVIKLMTSLGSFTLTN